MNRQRYVPLTPGHDAPLGALDLFEIYTVTIFIAALGWLTTVSSAQASLRNGCPKRYASLEFHAYASLGVAITIEAIVTVLHCL